MSEWQFLLDENIDSKAATYLDTMVDAYPNRDAFRNRELDAWV